MSNAEMLFDKLSVFLLGLDAYQSLIQRRIPVITKNIESELPSKARSMMGLRISATMQVKSVVTIIFLFVLQSGWIISDQMSFL